MTCDELVTIAPMYLSGELDASRMAEVQAHLEACPSCAAEIAQQTAADARLREEIVAKTPDSKAVDRRILRSILIQKWRPVAIGIAAVLVLAFIGALIRNSIRVSRVYADAALDHRREVVDHQPRTWVSDPSALNALATHQGLLPSSLSKLSRAGYTVERGKLCRLDGRVYLHIVYVRGGGEFSVFLRASGEPFPTALSNSDKGQEHVASFQTDLVAGMVVTDQSSEACRQFAHVAAALL